MLKMFSCQNQTIAVAFEGLVLFSLAVTVGEIRRSGPALSSNLALWKDPHYDSDDALVAIRELSLSAGADPGFSV